MDLGKEKGRDELHTNDGDGGMMMIGMGLVWLLIVVALLLAIAALVKYLRSGTK